jgi:hypothetical protein
VVGPVVVEPLDAAGLLYRLDDLLCLRVLAEKTAEERKIVRQIEFFNPFCTVIYTT